LIDGLGTAPSLLNFPPTRDAALARIRAIVPSEYARTRNALDGAVTGLSPYLTHGLVKVADVAQEVAQHHALGFEDKLVFELAWREFFHHVWGRAKDGGDAILQDMHSGAPWAGRYAGEVPPDVRQGRTGVPAIDAAVRVLYATGYLHNHARMWLASYVVHIRKVSWRAGADWLYSHLLDGDLPSNHLSWQWVAATFSSKPYLFNAENVRRYAPSAARAAWDCSGTVLDTSYEWLEDWARHHGDAGAEKGLRRSLEMGVDEPEVSAQANQRHLEPFMPAAQSKSAAAAIENIANNRQFRVELVHPWALSARQNSPSHKVLRVGVVHLPAHAAWPWSERRWQFVLAAMREVSDQLWFGDLRDLPLPADVQVSAHHTQFPLYRQALADLARRGVRLMEPERFFAHPAMACRSFSKFYDKARQEAGDFDRLLAP
jgi:deoxyribodipyrimidine photo-lyase